MKLNVNELIFVQSVEVDNYDTGIEKLESIKVVTTDNITEAQFDKMVADIKVRLFPKRETVKDIVNRTVKYANKKCSCKDDICKLNRVGQHYGLYCATCGKWIKWVSAKEVKTM